MARQAPNLWGLYLNPEGSGQVWFWQSPAPETLKGASDTLRAGAWRRRAASMAAARQSMAAAGAAGAAGVAGSAASAPARA